MFQKRSYQPFIFAYSTTTSCFKVKTQNLTWLLLMSWSWLKRLWKCGSQRFQTYSFNLFSKVKEKATEFNVLSEIRSIHRFSLCFIYLNTITRCNQNFYKMTKTYFMTAGKVTKIVHKTFYSRYVAMRMTLTTHSHLLHSFFVMLNLMISNLPKTYFHRWYRKFMSLFICYVIERTKKTINCEIFSRRLKLEKKNQ